MMTSSAPKLVVVAVDVVKTTMVLANGKSTGQGRFPDMPVVGDLVLDGLDSPSGGMERVVG